MQRKEKSKKRKKIEKLFNKYSADITIFIVQIAIFYLFPLFTGEFGEIMMVFFIILCTFAVSLMAPIFLHRKVRFFYPIATPVLFIPSVFIYYNESALLQTVWYFIICVIGFSLGLILRKFSGKKSMYDPYNKKIKEREYKD